MSDNETFSLSLRTKLVIAFVSIGISVGGGLSLFNYIHLKNKLLSDMHSHLRNIAQLGALTINKKAIGELSQKLPGISATNDNQLQVSIVEKSAAYQTVYDELNTIRDSYPDMIRYVYTFTKGPAPDKALFLVDADVLDLRKRVKKGLATEEVSYFGSIFDIEPFLTAQNALATGEVSLEPDFSYDEEFDSYLITGYAPIKDEKGSTIAVLGVDVSAKYANRLLNKSLSSSLYMTLGFIGFSLLLSALAGRSLSKAFTALDKVVRRFAENDFTVRAKMTSNDEAGRLGLSLNQMASLIEDSQIRANSVLAAYGKFVPEQYIQILGKHDITEIKLGDYSQRQMSVLFTDIPDFATMPESQNPFDAFAFINSLLERIGPIIRNHGGIIDKYMGNAIMALFTDLSDAAIRSAVGMLLELNDLNEFRQNYNFKPIQMNCGIHSGSIMMGTIGETDRMDGTAIGDSVNTASRLEHLADLYGARIVISEHVHQSLSLRHNYNMRYLDTVIVKGKTEPITIYEVIEGVKGEHAELKIKHCNRFEEAARAFHAGAIDDSFNLFQELTEQIPNDVATSLYIKRCRARILGKRIAGVDTAYLKKT